MLRYVYIDNTEGKAPIIKDYPQFDKFSKLNIEFILMEANGGDRGAVMHLLEEGGGMHVDMTAKVAYLSDAEESIRIYVVN
jgi:hypothetical protein